MTLIRTTIIALLMSCSLPLHAEEISLENDGWYSWHVKAGKEGQNSCCYSFRDGNVRRQGCSLGDGMNQFTVSEPCDFTSDTIRIFVEVRNGKVRDIRPLSSNCPVQSDSEVIAFHDVSTDQSIAWLQEQLKDNPKLADEAVMTLSFHAKDEALQALFSILENRSERQDTREQALFWLVQSDYDEAYAYLDRLLN